MIPLLLALACGGPTAETSVAVEPVDDPSAECAVCGMIVAEQPAPRGQLSYRDGTHAHFCSIGELRATIAARSARGTPTGVWVEVLPGDTDPAKVELAPHPWVPAASAWYVFGTERPAVMGLPTLTFTDEVTARAAADRLGLAAPVSWDAVTSTPFNKAPASP